MSGGSATAGADYAATGATLTIAAGAAQGTATVTLTPVDDRLDEGNETVQVGGTAGTLAVAPAPVTITDDDERGVTVTPAVLTVAEGDSGTYTVALNTQPTADGDGADDDRSGGHGRDGERGESRHAAVEVHAGELEPAADDHGRRGA